MYRLCLAALLALSGCASPYDPPVQGDRASAKYQADIARCRKQADLVATRKANATPQSAIMAVFKSADAEHHDVTLCMQQHGYVPSAAS